MKSFLKFILILANVSFITLLLPIFSFSQTPNAWTNLDLYGGQIYDVTIVPNNPAQIFVGSYQGDGLFVTANSGNSWQAVDTGNDTPAESTFKNQSVYAVKISPSNPSVIWVAHSYWVERSIDGGQTWSHISNTIIQGANDNQRFIQSLEIDPDDPDTAIVGTSGVNA